MTMNNNYQEKRRLVRWILIITALVIPFVKINGNSLIRFDVSELVLYLFGLSLPIYNFFFVLLITLFFTFFFIMMTLVYGRIWCGWLCPQSVTMEVTSFMDNKEKSAGPKKSLYIFYLVMISLIISLNMVFYFVDPYKFFSNLFNKGYIHPVTLGFIITLAIIVFLDIYLVRYRFCATVCPYSMIQSILYDDHTLAVYMKPETKSECINCLSCVKVCSTGIDIRQGLNSACINCAKCIDACESVMSKRGKSSLFAYLFGPKNDKNLKRPTVLISGLATAVFLVATVVAAVNIKSYSVELITNPKFYPRFTGDVAVNGFQFIAENLSNKEKSFTITAVTSIPLTLEPSSSIKVLPKEKKVENVFIKIPKEIAEKNQLLDIDIVIKDENNKELKKRITFRKPFAKKSGVK